MAWLYEVSMIWRFYSWPTPNKFLFSRLLLSTAYEELFNSLSFVGVIPLPLNYRWPSLPVYMINLIDASSPVMLESLSLLARLLSSRLVSRRLVEPSASSLEYLAILSSLARAVTLALYAPSLCDEGRFTLNRAEFVRELFYFYES